MQRAREREAANLELRRQRKAAEQRARYAALPWHKKIFGSEEALAAAATVDQKISVKGKEKVDSADSAAISSTSDQPVQAVKVKPPAEEKQPAEEKVRAEQKRQKDDELAPQAAEEKTRMERAAQAKTEQEEKARREDVAQAQKQLLIKQLTDLNAKQHETATLQKTSTLELSEVEQQTLAVLLQHHDFDDATLTQLTTTTAQLQVQIGKQQGAIVAVNKTLGLDPITQAEHNAIEANANLHDFYYMLRKVLSDAAVAAKAMVLTGLN